MLNQFTVDLHYLLSEGVVITIRKCQPPNYTIGLMRAGVLVYGDGNSLEAALSAATTKLRESQEKRLNRAT